jgi:hypothetical protein
MRNLAVRVARRLLREPGSLRARFSSALRPANPYFFSLCAAVAAGGSLRIVVVGANDGRINDPIFSFAEGFKASTELFLIEPQRALLPHLAESYAFHPRATIIDQAVGPGGAITLYAVDESAWPKLRVPYARDWPAYRAPTGVTSADRDHVRRWLQKYGPKGADVDPMIVEQVVQCSPLPELLRNAGPVQSIDVLQVDAEGMDDVVIYNSGIDELKPSIIYFEAENLSKDRSSQLISYLEQRGYALGSIGRDVLAVYSAGAG